METDVRAVTAKLSQLPRARQPSIVSNSPSRTPRYAHDSTTILSPQSELLVIKIVSTMLCIHDRLLTQY
jgi:hypothetical protein